MKNLIIIRIDGMMTTESIQEYKNQVLEDLKQGLLVIDNRVKYVTLTHLDEIGVEIKGEVIINEKEEI